MSHLYDTAILRIETFQELAGNVLNNANGPFWHLHEYSSDVDLCPQRDK
jgi:hypothetical protein